LDRDRRGPTGLAGAGLRNRRCAIREIRMRGLRNLPKSRNARLVTAAQIAGASWQTSCNGARANRGAQSLRRTKVAERS